MANLTTASQYKIYETQNLRDICEILECFSITSITDNPDLMLIDIFRLYIIIYLKKV